jgi:hypothetical protein
MLTNFSISGSHSTAFYYHGFSNVTHMNMVVCRDNPGAAECAPREPLDIVDHYFYFSNVSGQTAVQLEAPH